MKKIVLKRIRYYNLPLTIFFIVVSAVILFFIFFDLLSGVRKLSDSTFIGSLIFFAACLFFFLWRLFAKKPQADYININGWEYRLFQRASKWKFICISGFLSSIRSSIIFAVVFLSNLIKHGMSPLQVILIAVGLCGLTIVPYGYINYKKCASVDLNSDFTHPFYKK